MAIKQANFTMLPNDFIDQNMNKLTGSATKIFIIICRQTTGWGKERDRLSLSQLSSKSGLSVSGVKLALIELNSKDLINTFKTGYGKGSQCSFSLKVENCESESNELEKDMSQKVTHKISYEPESDSKTDFMSQKVTTQKKDINKLIIKEILLHWNSKNNLTKHRENIILDKVKTSHIKIINEYGIGNIKKAIDNYSDITSNKSGLYYWTHDSWTVLEFISRGIEKFVEEAEPKKHLLSKKDKASTKSVYQEI